MLGWKIVHKRELLLYSVQIDDLKKQVEKLEKQVLDERYRAEGAINALLIKTNKIALAPRPEGMTLEQELEFKDKKFNIFGDGEVTEDEALEALQGGKEPKK